MGALSAAARPDEMLQRREKRMKIRKYLLCLLFIAVVVISWMTEMDTLNKGIVTAAALFAIYALLKGN